jgi:hypothetical protein
MSDKVVCTLCVTVDPRELGNVLRRAAVLADVNVQTGAIGWQHTLTAWQTASADATTVAVGAMNVTPAI